MASEADRGGSSLREILINRVLPRVQSPGQYIGGEWNSICKDRAAVRGRFCFAFPEPYTIGMSHHGLQVLYAIMNARDDWACERVFTPLTDLESLLREGGLPLVSLESFTPLGEFDVVGFSLQHELSASNVLTMLDLGGIPLAAESRGMAHPLILAGGPCAANPEPMARFIDAFLLGDGEEALPAVCDLWLEMRTAGLDRAAALARLAARLPYLYVPRFYRPQFGAQGRPAGLRPTRDDLPPSIEPAVVRDLDAAAAPWPPSCPSSSASTSGSPSKSCGAVPGVAASARAVPSSIRSASAAWKPSSPRPCMPIGPPGIAKSHCWGSPPATIRRSRSCSPSSMPSSGRWA